MAGTAHAVLSNGALECGSSATYYPQSWWGVNRNGIIDDPIIYSLQKDGVSNIPNNADMAAITAAFGEWSSINCNSGGRPKLRLQRGADHDSRDNGDITSQPYQVNNFKNVIWFEENNWTDDASILAFTNNLSSPQTGRTATADIVYNAVTYEWRATDPGSGQTYGCARPAVGQTSNCYDVRNTATHEIGHFLGFYHVNCSDAVMYPTASPTAQTYSLSYHEITGMCTLYAPIAFANGDTLKRGEVCDRGSGPLCESGLVCAVPADFPQGTGWGICTSNCDDDDDCPDAFGCNTATGWCVPAPHNTGAGTGTATPSDCTICLTQADCGSGLCVRENASDANGYCSRACSDAFPCASGYTCVTLDDSSGSVCYPNNPANCSTGDNEGGSLNDLCFIEGEDGQEDQEAACGAGLICIGFQPASCVGIVGGCVNYCNAFTQPYNGQRCPDPNQICCYGVADDGLSCRRTADANHDEGGCFTERKVGESCVTTDNAFCEAGSRCLNDGVNASSSVCYRTCDNGVCGAGEICRSGTDTCGDNITFCCDEETFNRDRNCIPRGANFKRQLGVECSQSSECASDVCYNLNGQSACSRRCNNITGGGCPGNIDVNGDATADGGFTCSIEANGDGWCWPRTGRPAEFLQNGGEEEDGGCSSAGADIFAALAVVMLLGRRFRVR